MISPKVFERHGCDAASLRKVFEKREKYEYPEKIIALLGCIRSRMQQGRMQNLKDYKYFAAMDYAYDAPYYQTTPTLVQHVCNQTLTYEESLKAVEGWGLRWGDIFRIKLKPDGTKDLDLKTGQPQLEVIAPSLVRTLVPMVKSYLTIRCAKLFTDRNQVPLFKFEPLRNTDENTVLCEVLNNVMEGMVTQFGYRDELRDAIFHTLLYGINILFPQEAWYEEKQENEDGTERVVREGIRYIQPHPTRMFYDLFYRTSSLNSDSGCEYTGHWRVERYGEIRSNPLYFNQNAIPYGTNWFQSPYAGTYFSDFYPPCTMTFPSGEPLNPQMRETSAGVYATTDTDKALFVTEVFMKLKPEEWDLYWPGDGEKKAKPYKNPAWFRFVMASDDTVVYAEPMCYTPNIYYGYDADGSRVRNASMALELIPFQDQLGNLLSQILLTVKQNLANVVFYDTNIVDADQIRKLNNAGETALRGINLVGTTSEKNLKAGLDNRTAFQPITLSRQSTGELMNTMNTVISIAERMLAFSAQELGSAASHQQSAEEMRVISNSIGVRVAYTGTFIDDANDAWKRQLASAMMAYMDVDFVAEISPDTKNLDEILKKLGFSVVSQGSGKTKTVINGSKVKLLPLLIDGLVSNKDGPDRGTDAQAAAVMMQTVQAVAGNPELAQQVGPQNLLQLLTRAARMGGAPRDFELQLAAGGQTAKPLTLEDVQKLIQQQGQQLMQTIGKEVADQVVKPAAAQDAKQQQEIDQMASQLATVEQVVGKLTQIFAGANAAPPPQEVQPPMPPQPAPIDVNQQPPPEAGQVPVGPAGQPGPSQMAGGPGSPTP